MVGRTAAHTEELEAQRPMTELFNRLLPALFDLAADADSVIQAGLQISILSDMEHFRTFGSCKELFYENLYCCDWLWPFFE